MEISWHISKDDATKVLAFYQKHSSNPFVVNRITQNLSDQVIPVSIDLFWDRLVGCLLTTQQRSGPTSAISRFLQIAPSPLRLEVCAEQAGLSGFVTEVLSDFGGIRRSKTIGTEIETNYTFLTCGGWEQTAPNIESVHVKRNKRAEREAAKFVCDNFRGFGPKQSRNLLQGLGVSRYEIPIDSRITKWLNDFGFPVRLSANALQDHHYYDFVSDGFQELCKACDIVPCVLDAAIFASFDGNKWTEGNVSW